MEKWYYFPIQTTQNVHMKIPRRLMLHGLASAWELQRFPQAQILVHHRLLTMMMMRGRRPRARGWELSDADEWEEPVALSHSAQYLQRELEAQRAQTARIELLRAQVAECLLDAEAEQQLEQQESQVPLRDATDDPPPYDAPSFPSGSVSASTSRGSLEAWDPEHPRVWRRRSAAYSSLATDAADTGGGLHARRRAPRLLNPVLDDLVVEYSREWNIPLEDTEGGVFPEFVDLEVLSDSVMAAKMQERKRLRRQWRRAASEKAHAVARILSKLRMRQTWAAWLVQHRADAETARRRTRHLALVQKVRFRLAHRAVAGAFGTWKAMLKGICAQRALLVRALGRMKHMHLASAWAVWTAYFARVRNSRHVLKGTLLRLQHSKLGASFATWCEYSTSQRRTKRIGKRVASRLYNMRLSAAFARWDWLVEQTKRIKSIMQSVALRVRNLSMSTAWAQWHAHVAQSLKTQMAGRVVLKRLKNATVAKTFRQWIAWILQLKHEARLLRKVAGKMKHRTASSAFMTWNASARDAVLQREAAARVEKAAGRMVRQWIMRSLSAAMRSWRATTDKILRQRYELSKIALRWHNRQLSNAWLMLSEACDAARAEREDEVARAREEARQLVAQEKAVSLLCGRRGMEFCRRIMILWLGWAAVSGRLRRLLSRGAAHQRENLLRGTLEGWSATAAKLRSLRRLGEKLTGRLSDHTMKSALLQWHRGASQAAAKRRSEGKLRKFVLSQAALRSRAVFEGWADANRRMVRNRKAVASAVKKICLKDAMLCLEIWTAYVLRQQEKIAKLRRAALRFSRTSVVKAFGAWHERVQLVTQLHKLLGKSTKRQAERQRAQCYAAWVHAVRVVQQYRTISAKIARKASRIIYRDALRGWRQLAEETARLNATLRRCLMRVARGTIGSAFNRWLAAISVDESRRHAAARFAMGAALTRSRIMLREWAAVSAKIAEENRRRENTLRSALQRMMMRSKTLAFECWVELFDAAQLRKELLAKALRRLKSLGTAKALHHWRGVLLEKRRRQARAVHAVLVADTRLCLKRGGRVLRTWIGWVRVRKSQRAMVCKGRRKCARVALKYCISALRTHAKQHRYSAAALRKMLNWHLALSFRSWRQLLERKRERFGLFLSTLGQWADGFTIRRIFARWASCVEQLTGAFRPALAGLSPNLAARYKDIVEENEFVQHPAVSPGLRDHSPRPLSPLRHIDVRSSGSDYSLRGSAEGSSQLLGGSVVGSPSESLLGLQGYLPGAGIERTTPSPIADWSLEQLATAASPPPSQLGTANGFQSAAPALKGPLSAQTGTASSLSGFLDFGPERRGIPSSAQENRRHELSLAEKRAQSLAHLKARGPPPQPLAQMRAHQVQHPFDRKSFGAGMALSSSLATTASGTSYDGLPPTTAIPQLTSAELWLQQRRSRPPAHGFPSQPAVLADGRG